jgi:hypothetical protein
MTTIAEAKAWHEKHERSLEESWKALSGGRLCHRLSQCQRRRISSR